MTVTVSFEFFPPKTPELEESLWRSIRRLEPLKPTFVSVTYGAGGSTQERTRNTVKKILDTTKLTPVAHLTCVGSSKDQIKSIAQEYWDSGIKHILALRGDPPADIKNFQPHPEGYHHASELVTGLKTIADFDIAVAAFPEGHPESKDLESDTINLKKKIDAGASKAITQFFFDNDLFYKLRDRCRKHKVNCELIPGIMPVSNFVQMQNFAKGAGASVPTWLAKQFEGLEEDPDTRKLVAATIAAKQVEDLVKNGVEHIHFYTLNRADLSFAICHMLGLRTN